MIYYLSRNYRNTTSAGNKAKTDIEAIMEHLGYITAGMPQSHIKSSAGAFIRTLASVIKAPFDLHKGDILVVQYPLKKYFSSVCHAAHFRGSKVVAVIHDLGSFRRKALSPEQEIRRLNNADFIIAHNESMRAWLEQHGIKKPVDILGIFDYLSVTQSPVRKSMPDDNPKIVYAGGLNRRKNAFIYRMGNHIGNCSVTLYGRGFEPDAAECADKFDYKGFTPSDTLIATADGHFGLVWDGDSTDGCTGDFGEYLRFNNPHKVSLYIRCNLPVILWDKAAMAPFITANGLGFTVSNLDEIPARIAALSASEYQSMLQNVETMSRQLSKGHFINAALSRAVNVLINE